MSVLGALHPQPGGGRWLEPLRHWPQAALQLLTREPAVVRVLVAGLRGSGPREAGACMLIGRHSWLGTIGGGRLEHEAQQAAQAMLSASAPQARVLRITLGSDLGQCCGGVVALWLERYSAEDAPLLQQLAVAGTALRLDARLLADGRVCRRLLGTDGALSPSPSPAGNRGEHKHIPQLHHHADGSTQLLEALPSADPPLYLYGAGHVGQALVRVLAGLPYAVHWIDSRADLIPTDLPASVTPLATPFPLDTLQHAPPQALYLVMTHDHALDYALCDAILRRGAFAFLGLIGSDSKAARFRSRLARDGHSPQAIARLQCPVGLPGIHSKQAAAIAVSIAAQLLQVTNTAAQRPATPIETCTPEGCAACPQTHRPR